MVYSCDDCRRIVDEDDAFIRSLAFRQVAWCQSCWRERRGLPAIPEQRQGPQAPARTPRRWIARRDEPAGRA